MTHIKSALLHLSVFCVFSSSCIAAEECVEEKMPSIQAVAQYVDEGFRPLSDEEVAEMPGAGKVDKSDDWRPKSSGSDCDKQSSSLLQPEERGYRPLDYGTRQYKEAENKRQQENEYKGRSDWWNYPQGYGAYGGYYNPYASPAYPWAQGYPGYQGGYGYPQGGYPYYPMPQFLPGYGVMPFSFGGSGVPY
jgi:hypothetical protein